MTRRTPADVPELPASDLTEYEREQVAVFSARDAGGMFMPAHELSILREYHSLSPLSGQDCATCRVPAPCATRRMLDAVDEWDAVGPAGTGSADSEPPF